MNDWFRSWHGAPTDPKWQVIARRAGQPASVVVALAWALMDRASQAADRGSVQGYDAEELAYCFGCETGDVERVVAAFIDKGVLTPSFRFAAWERRQPKRDDDSRRRVAEHRERKRCEQASAASPTVTSDEKRNVTPCNAEKRDVTLEESREDTDKGSVAYASKEATATAGAQPELDLEQSDPEQWFWDRAGELGDRGCARSQFGALVNLQDGNWRGLISTMKRIMAVKEPAPFLNAIVADLRRDAAANIPRSSAPAGRKRRNDEPDFVRNARSEGQHIEISKRKNGRPSYRIGGEIFDEHGAVIGF